MNSEIAATNLESVGRKKVSSCRSKPIGKRIKNGPRRKTVIKR
jgi:hypothetical protein